MILQLYQNKLKNYTFLCIQIIHREIEKETNKTNVSKQYDKAFDNTFLLFDI